MRTILSAGVLAVLLLVCAGAAPEGEWNVTFGGTDCDYAQSVQQTADGGYILAGYTTSYGAGSSDMWLVKVDVGGNEQWNKTFGGTGEEQAKSIQQTSDGGYVLAGSTSWNARLKLSTAAQIRGDLNSDCILTPADAAIALEIAVGSRPCDAATLDAADVSGDGRVTSLDALMILQAAAGRIEL